MPSVGKVTRVVPTARTSLSLKGLVSHQVPRVANIGPSKERCVVSPACVVSRSDATYQVGCRVGPYTNSTAKIVALYWKIPTPQPGSSGFHQRSVNLESVGE